MPLSVILIVLLIVFSAAFVRSAFGFGEGMINMSLLTLFVDFEFSVPFVALIAVMTGIMMIVQDWKLIEWKEIFLMLIAAVIFVPVGLYTAEFVEARVMQIFLGLLIIIFSLFKLMAPSLGKIKNPRWALFFGALGGFFGVAYNISGPPAIIYGSMRNWSPAVFRISLQGYYLPIAVFALTARVWIGQYNSAILTTFAYAVPLVLLGILLGRMLNKSIKNPESFQRYIYLIFIILGFLLIF